MSGVYWKWLSNCCSTCWSKNTIKNAFFSSHSKASRLSHCIYSSYMKRAVIAEMNTAASLVLKLWFESCATSDTERRLTAVVPQTNGCLLHYSDQSNEWHGSQIRWKWRKEANFSIHPHLISDFSHGNFFVLFPNLNLRLRIAQSSFRYHD